MIFYFIIFLLFAGLIGLVFWYRNKYKTVDGYYKYSQEKAEFFEHKYEKEKSDVEDEIKKLKNIAYTNVTTNIWNIDFFIEKGEDMLKRSSSENITLVAFSITNIGKINQLFGPTEGDKAVYFAAQTLKKVPFSTRYVYAQVYSNLFCFLVDGAKTEEVLHTIEWLTDKLVNYDPNIRIESSYGIYEKIPTEDKIMDSVSCANLALNTNRGKKDDINYVFYTDELREEYDNNKRMSIEMEEALENHKFVMFLQPIVDMKSSKIVSAEALVRWDYPGKGLLSPYAFLPVFEGTSLIKKLDYYMWEECLKTIRHWIDNKIEPVPISMNISSAHLQSTGFIDKLCELTEQYLIDRNLLVLEIPEKGITTNMESMRMITERLEAEGFHMCVDNFGSVNSPLNLLKDYSFDRIKIDRKFLVRNSDTAEGLTILRYLVAMAKELDFIVITEGIETIEQVNNLVDLGSDLGQGYYFSKPISLREFDELGKTRLSDYYRPDEYYPTFEEYEKDVDLIVQMFQNATRYKEWAQQ